MNNSFAFLRKLPNISIIALYFLSFLMFVGICRVILYPINNDYGVYNILEPDIRWYTCVRLANSPRLDMKLYNLFKSKKHNDTFNLAVHHLPKNLNSLSDKEKVFLLAQSIMPFILDIEDEIKKDQESLTQFMSLAQFNTLTGDEVDAIENLAKKYYVPYVSSNIWDLFDTLDALVIKAQPIPRDIIIAIFAHEILHNNQNIIVQQSNFMRSVDYSVYASTVRMGILRRFILKKDLKYNVRYLVDYMNMSSNLKGFRKTRAKGDLRARRLLYAALAKSDGTVDTDYLNSVYRIINTNNLYHFNHLKANSSKNNCVYIHG